MDLLDKRRLEIQEIKESRKQQVIIKTIELFYKNGIQACKMTDVAQYAEIGIASLYRYFKTKQELVISAGEYFWEKEVNQYYRQYMKDHPGPGQGLAQVSYLFELFLDLFENHKHIIHFIEDFDSFIVQEGVESSRLKKYDHISRLSAQTIVSTIQIAQQMGQVRAGFDIECFVHTTELSLLGLCQKHISRAQIVPSDAFVQGRKEIRMMIDMAINYIKK